MIAGLSGLDRGRWNLTELGKLTISDRTFESLGEVEIGILYDLFINGPQAGLYLGINGHLVREEANFALSRLYYKKLIREDGEGLDEVCKN